MNKKTMMRMTAILDILTLDFFAKIPCSLLVVRLFQFQS